MSDVEQQNLLNSQIGWTTSALEEMYRHVRATYENMTTQQRRAQVGEDVLKLDKVLMDLTIEVNRLISLMKGE